MSAPIVAGAGLVSLPAALTSGISSVQLLVGVGVSFATGLLAIRIFLRLIERASLWPFVVYLVLLAGIVGWYAL
jgi:undecaprenyl-diphosphatase